MLLVSFKVTFSDDIIAALEQLKPDEKGFGFV
jgi:hypothetical protein